LKNILALQDDVARDIAGQIQVRVTPQEKALLTTDLSQTPGDVAYNFAAVAIRLGKERDALLYLERALVERSYWIPFLNIDPRFDALP